MKVPKYIKEKMHEIARLSKRTQTIVGEVEQYFRNRDYDIDALRANDGISLTELDCGNDVTEKLCKAIEEDDYGKNDYFPYKKYEDE